MMWYVIIFLISVQHVLMSAENESVVLGSDDRIVPFMDLALVKRLPIAIQNRIRFFVDGVCEERDEQFKNRVHTQQQAGWIPPDTLTMSLPLNFLQKIIINSKGISFYQPPSKIKQLDTKIKYNKFIEDFLYQGITFRSPMRTQCPLLANTSANGNQIVWLTGITEHTHVYQKPLYIGAYNCNTGKKRTFDCARIMENEDDFFVVKKKPYDTTAYEKQGFHIISKMYLLYIVLYNPIRRIAINNSGRYVTLLTNVTCYLVDMQHNLYHKYPLEKQLGDSHYDFNNVSTFCADEQLGNKIIVPQALSETIFSQQKPQIKQNKVNLTSASVNLLSHYFQSKGICKDWQENSAQ